jgi:hypothetical protein
MLQLSLIAGFHCFTSSKNSARRIGLVQVASGAAKLPRQKLCIDLDTPWPMVGTTVSAGQKKLLLLVASCSECYQQAVFVQIMSDNLHSCYRAHSRGILTIDHFVSTREALILATV